MGALYLKIWSEILCNDFGTRSS